MTQPRIHIALAAIFSLVPLLYHFWAYQGHYGFDDMRYAEIAYHISIGIPDVGHNFFYRFFLVGLTALSYKLFGISDFTSGLAAMLVTVGTLWLMYPILRKQRPIVALLAYALFTFSGSVIFFSDKLSADPFITFAFMLAALALYLQFVSEPTRPVRNAFLLALAVLLGVCTKETVLFMAPWLGILFLWYVLKSRRFGRFWLLAIGWGVLFGALYVGIVAWLTGDLYIRFQAAMDGRYLSFCSYDQQPLSVVMERVTIGLPTMMVQNGMVLPVILAAVLGAIELFRRKAKSSEVFFCIQVLLLLLVANFLTVSPSGYSPLCLDPRHYLFLIPLAALGVAPVIYRITNGIRDSQYWLLVLLLSFAAAFAWYKGFESFRTVSIPLLVWLLLAGVLPRNMRWRQAVLVGAFIVAYGYQMASYTLYARSVQFPAQRAFLQKEVLNRGVPMLVYTDRVQLRLGRYYQGFREDAPVMFREFPEMESAQPTSHNSKWILYNGYTAWLAGLAWEKVPALVKYALAHHKPVAEVPGVALFDIKAFPTLAPLDTLEFWPCGQGGECHISPDQSTNSLTVGLGEWADTSDSTALIVLDVDFQLKTEHAMEPELHFTLMRNGNRQHHVAFPLFSFVKAYGNWSSVQVQQYYLTDEIEPGDSVNVRFLNPGGGAFTVQEVEVSRAVMPR